MRAAPKQSVYTGSYVSRFESKTKKKPVLDQVISTGPYELRSESDDTDKTVSLIFNFNF